MTPSSTTNRALSIGIGIASIVFAANWSGIWLPEVSAITRPAHSSYSVDLMETSRDASGKTTGSHEYRFSLTSAGTYALKVEGPLGLVDKRVSRQIFLPSGVEVKVNDLAELKSTRRTQPPTMRKPATQCMFTEVGESLVATEKVDGYRAAKVTRPHVSEPRRTSWYSLDHGCALLRERGEWNDGTVSEKRLVRLMVGEPEMSLVTVPEHYTEIAPSGLLPGLNHTATMHTALSKLDEDYYKHRP